MARYAAALISCASESNRKMAKNVSTTSIGEK
jgi:hypothetical protein